MTETIWSGLFRGEEVSILVTGGAGYIGSHVAHALRDAGHDVCIVDDLSAGHPELVPPSVPLVRGDVADAALITSTIRKYAVTAVMHFAGRISVPESVAVPLEYYDWNTARSLSLLSACVKADVKKFIFSSTAAVYGLGDGCPVSEESPKNPLSPYGWSKLLFERMLQDASDAHDLRFVALRYFNVAGADPQGRSGQRGPEVTHLIRLACLHALGLRPQLSIFGTDYDTPDGTCVRDYIHVSDLADTHLQALVHLDRGGDSAIFNCGYGRGYSVLEVAAAMERACGKPLTLVHTDRRPGDPPVLIADNSKLVSRLGWRPRHDDLDGIVSSALAWERRLRNL